MRLLQQGGCVATGCTNIVSLPHVLNMQIETTRYGNHNGTRINPHRDGLTSKNRSDASRCACQNDITLLQREDLTDVLRRI